MSLLSLSHWALSHSDAVCCYSYAQNSAQLQRRAFANLLALFLWIRLLQKNYKTWYVFNIQKYFE